MHKARGFSLIELLIVVEIILILAALAIPNLLRSKMSANEAAAVSALRTINTAQATYAMTYPNLGYADTLTKLRMPADGTPVSENEAGLLDWVLGCEAQPCHKAGYDFAIVNSAEPPSFSYDVTAVPSSVGQTGRRGFCTNQVPKLMYDPEGGTDCNTPLQ